MDDATGQADWTPLLFEEFQKRRGYDLRRHLPALFGRDREDVNARVLADYRETISDLLLDTFTAEWRRWAVGQKRQVRNQAHGSPANILDLYAASDIPETEGAEIQRFKWATSAAHVAGRPLVSAEAATWLGEHFRSTLADVRAAVDRFFVAGVNHIFYHGTAYSPIGEPWPGWQFYAAVEFNPQNAWWDDFGALNGYVARVQSFLQAGTPDADALLYYPFYEALSVRENGLLTHFGGASPPPQGTTFEEAAVRLQTWRVHVRLRLRSPGAWHACREQPAPHRRRRVLSPHRGAVGAVHSARNVRADPDTRTEWHDRCVAQRLAG